MIGATLPARPWSWLVVAGLMTIVLVPGVILSYTHGPLFDLQSATIPPGQGRAVALRFTLELLVTASLAGALAGVLLGRSARGAVACATAALAFAIGPGHNIPMFGNHPVALKGHALMLAIVVATSVSFVEIVSRLDAPSD